MRSVCVSTQASSQSVGVVHAGTWRSEHAPPRHLGALAASAAVAREDPMFRSPAGVRMGRVVAHDAARPRTGLRGLLEDRSAERTARVPRPWADGVLLTPHATPLRHEPRRATAPAYRADGADAYAETAAEFRDRLARAAAATPAARHLADDGTVHLENSFRTSTFDVFTRAAPSGARVTSSEAEARLPPTGGRDVQRALQPDVFARTPQLAELSVAPLGSTRHQFGGAVRVTSELPPSASTSLAAR